MCMYRWIQRNLGFLQTGKGNTQWRIYLRSWRRKCLRRITGSLFNLQKVLASSSFWNLLVCWKSLPLLILKYVSGGSPLSFSSSFLIYEKMVYVDGDDDDDVVRLIIWSFIIVCKLSKTESSPLSMCSIFSIYILRLF